MTKTLTPSQMVNVGGGIPSIENPAIMGIGHGQPGLQYHNPQVHHEVAYKPPQHHPPLPNPLRIPPNDIDAYFNSNKPLREFDFVLAFISSL